MTRFVAFTGSKEVGLDINQRAATPRPGQKWIKRTILEMGGKDSIIVDADANLDAAVEGVAQAAFGFQGQKVLRLLTRHCRRKNLRRVSGAPERARSKDHRGRSHGEQTDGPGGE